MSIPLIAVRNACVDIKNWVQSGGLQELGEKISAGGLQSEANRLHGAQENLEAKSNMNTTIIGCKTCGGDADAGAKFCPSCGTPIIHSTCYTCNSPMPEGSRFCSKCGASQDQTSNASQLAAPSERTFSGFPTYYQQEFKRIRASGETYKGKWNWSAFLFGGIWALTKGLWLPALICFVGAILTGGIVGVAYWFVFGARGNYMYYCKETKHRNIPV